MFNDLSQAAFRPFFLLAGVAAVAGGLSWLAPGEDAVFVHVHLLLFGMGGAAMAGYLLTALPSWTGRHHLPAAVLWVLVGLWGLGRAVVPLAGHLPVVAQVLPGAAFHVLLAAWLVHGVAGAGMWRRVPLALAPLGPGMAEQYLLASQRAGGWVGDAGLLGVLVFALLMVAIGGRAVPAFTQAGLRHLGRADSVRAPDWPQWVSLGLLSASLAMALGKGAAGWTGALLLCTGVLQFMRWLGWWPWRLGGLPAVWMLHGAWVWLALGLVLQGAALLGWAWPGGLGPGTALHALTMGAMGGMCLGIMLRAAMRRTSSGLQPTGMQMLAAALVLVSPVLRLQPLSMLGDALRQPAVCWCLGWGLFVLAMWPAMRGPVVHPVLSGLRPPAEVAHS